MIRIRIVEVADSVECSLPKVGYAVRHHFALTGSYRDTAMLLLQHLFRCGTITRSSHHHCWLQTECREFIKKDLDDEMNFIKDFHL